MNATSSVRPRNDWIVVKLDQPPEPKTGELWVPPSQEDAVRTGVIVETGPGRTSKKGKIIPMEATPGMKVAFFRANFETLNGKTLQRVLQQIDKDIALIQERDILYEIIED